MPYESVLSTASLLASRQQGDVQRQADLADAHDSLGKIALEQGQLAQAIADYRDVHRIKSELLSRSPDDRDAGRLQEAAEHDVEALRVLSELVATDETNSAWQRVATRQRSRASTGAQHARQS